MHDRQVAVYFCSATRQPLSARERPVLVCATFDSHGNDDPLSPARHQRFTLCASSPSTLSAFVAKAKRTRSDAVEQATASGSFIGALRRAESA
jgi:hypothetical protein